MHAFYFTCVRTLHTPHLYTVLVDRTCITQQHRRTRKNSLKTLSTWCKIAHTFEAPLLPLFVLASSDVFSDAAGICTPAFPFVSGGGGGGPFFVNAVYQIVPARVSITPTNIQAPKRSWKMR